MLKLKQTICIRIQWMSLYESQRDTLYCIWHKKKCENVHIFFNHSSISESNLHLLKYNSTSRSAVLPSLKWLPFLFIYIKDFWGCILAVAWHILVSVALCFYLHLIWHLNFVWVDVAFIVRFSRSFVQDTEHQIALSGQRFLICATQNNHKALFKM